LPLSSDAQIPLDAQSSVVVARTDLHERAYDAPVGGDVAHDALHDDFHARSVRAEKTSETQFISEHSLRTGRRALSALLGREHAAIARAWTARHLAIEQIREGVAATADDSDLTRFYRNAYLRPLLLLLRGVAAGDRPGFRAVYLDERLRYAVPADLKLAVHDAVLGPLLDADSADLIARLPPAARRAAAAFLTDLHAPLTRAAVGRPVNVLLIGDCVMTELRAFLVGQCRDRQTDVRIRHQYISFERGIELDVSQIAGHLTTGTIDLIALSFFTFEGLPLYRALLADAPKLSISALVERVDALTGIVRQIVSSLRASTDVPILLHTACGLPLDRIRRRVPFVAPLAKARRDVIELLNLGVREVAADIENVIIIDEERAIGPAGLRGAARYIVPRSIRSGSVLHTTAVGPLLAAAYAPVIDAYARLRRTKVLLVDFDNTLWSGVMADGDVVHDVRAQRLLRKLREAGILLVALSKNDPAQIRWNEMALTPDDFVLHKISWDQKAQALGEAVQQLDVGIDTFTLIDDNPVERGLIADQFPQVTVLDPTLPETWDAIELLLSFPNTRQTEESAARTSLYRAAADRRAAMVAELDYPAMMRSLDLRATWSVARAKDANRIHELLSRTNQFNTTTRRRTPAELKSLLADPAHTVFVCSLTDRFGDLGIVGVSIIETGGDALVFDSVVMSCRAMGFGLEMLLVRGPLDHDLAATGARRAARGVFIKTARNEPAAALFEKAGFAYDAAADAWSLPAEAPLPDVPDWLTIVYA
jgi:FkbH-like protein